MFIRRRIPLARLNLLTNPARAIVSVLGVTFALLLIFMQLGFLSAVANTATIVYSKLKFDLLLRSPEYLHLYEAKSIDRKWINLIKGHSAVESANPFYIMLQKWQSPQDGRFRAIAMMSMPPNENLIDVDEIGSLLPRLSAVNHVLIDRATRPDYGPTNGMKFGDQDIGRTAELGNQEVKIVGHFFLGTGLATNGAVLINDVGYAKRSPIDVRKQSNLGLLRLKPGTNAASAVLDIRAWLSARDPLASESVQLFTRNEAIEWEHRRWLTETPIGIIFQIGVGLAFLVGAAIVYMVLAADVASKLPEYATMKAMGYRPIQLAAVVLQQAWWLSIAGMIPAYFLAQLLYYWTASLAGIPIYMTWQRAMGVACLSIVMCTISGGLAIRKLWKAEPAELF